MCAVVGSGRLWRVPQSSGAGWCRFRRQVAEAKFRRQVVPLVQEQPCDCFEQLLVMTLSTWATPLRKGNRAHVVKHGIRIYICVYIYIWYATAVGDATKAYFFPQQRKLMRFSAQVSSGVCRCGSQEQVPEEGCGRFRNVPESSGVIWCKFQRQIPEGSGEFWCKMV